MQPVNSLRGATSPNIFATTFAPQQVSGQRLSEQHAAHGVQINAAAARHLQHSGRSLREARTLRVCCVSIHRDDSPESWAAGRALCSLLRQSHRQLAKAKKAKKYVSLRNLRDFELPNASASRAPPLPPDWVKHTLAQQNPRSDESDRAIENLFSSRHRSTSDFYDHSFPANDETFKSAPAGYGHAATAPGLSVLDVSELRSAMKTSRDHERPQGSERGAGDGGSTRIQSHDEGELPTFARERLSSVPESRLREVHSRGTELGVGFDGDTIFRDRSNSHRPKRHSASSRPESSPMMDSYRLSGHRSASVQPAQRQSHEGGSCARDGSRSGSHDVSEPFRPRSVSDRHKREGGSHHSGSGSGSTCASRAFTEPYRPRSLSERSVMSTDSSKLRFQTASSEMAEMEIAQAQLRAFLGS